jgi:hypothetical protein
MNQNLTQEINFSVKLLYPSDNLGICITDMLTIASDVSHM